MRTEELLKVISGIKSRYLPSQCVFCAEETLCGAEISICSNCECIIHSGSSTKISGSIAAQLQIIKSSIAAGNYDAAGLAYDEIIKEKPMPQYLYAKGVMLIDYSNAIVRAIRYDFEGFMEQNAVMREKSFKIDAEAKKLFAKAIYLLQSGDIATKDVESQYILFLCYLRMGKIRGAHDVLSNISMGENVMISEYSSLLYFQAIMDYKESGKRVEAMIALNGFPVNILYYKAFCELKKMELKDAAKIADALKDILEDHKIKKIQEEIKTLE